MRTDIELNRLVSTPHLTVELMEAVEQRVLRTEAEANEQFLQNLRMRKANRAYKMSITKPNPSVSLALEIEELE